MRPLVHKTNVTFSLKAYCRKLMRLSLYRLEETMKCTGQELFNALTQREMIQLFTGTYLSSSTRKQTLPLPEKNFKISNSALQHSFILKVRDLF